MKDKEISHLQRELDSAGNLHFEGPAAELANSNSNASNSSVCYSNLQKKLLAHQENEAQYARNGRNGGSRSSKDESPLDDAIDKHARVHNGYSTNNNGFAINMTGQAAPGGTYSGAFGSRTNFGQGNRGMQQFEAVLDNVSNFHFMHAGSFREVRENCWENLIHQLVQGSW